MKNFNNFHPFALFTYFASMLLICMFTMHPVVLSIVCVGGLLFFAVTSTKKEFFSSVGFYILIFVLVAATNPFFGKEGATKIFIIAKKAITLEAIINGLAIGAMLVGIMLWCKCYIIVMTTDKFMYLFGSISPKISLMIAMILRFVPSVKTQAAQVRASQKMLGLYKTGGLKQRLKAEGQVFGALVGWVLENSIETADTMRARGFGAAKRSSFSFFVFKIKDAVLIAESMGVLVLFMIMLAKNKLAVNFHPVYTMPKPELATMLTYIFVFVLAATPFIIELGGNIRWKYLQQKI